MAPRKKTTDAPAPPGISFIIPAYNEEREIENTTRAVVAALKKLKRPFEVIVVNDGSKDDTRENALKNKDVQVISHPVNSGYGRSIKTGILAAKYEWVGIVDADGTYAIDEVGSLVEEMDNGFDMVVARRRNISEHDSFSKRIMRWLLIAFIRFFVDADLVDPNSGFRIFRKSLALLFFPFLCNTFSFTTSITLFAAGEAFFIKYVETEYFARTGKSKVRKFRDSLRMIQLVLQGITFFNPVKFYLLLAAAQVIGVALPSWILHQIGWSGTADIYLLSGTVAIVLVGIGVLADMFRISVNYDFAAGRFDAERRAAAAKN